MVDIDPQRLYAWGLSPRDVNAALGLQNVIVPTGTAKIGVDEYPIVLNASPELLDQLESIPIKVVRGTTVFIRDVANVRDGSTPQTNIVHVEGKKSVLMSILKLGSASTLDVVKRIRETLPATLARLPKELKVSLLFDQSVFVRAAVQGVVKEACIAAGLTAVMLLVFLGSWRSTLIVIVSIPLSILVSIIVLAWVGETLNVMTLGGMALAVGILVDDATVEIENVHRNMAQQKPVVRAILDGAAEIATPAFVSTICICIVFVPVAFIAGAARSLFVPLALAVVFAMLTSYFLSRTLVPTMMRFLLAREAHHHGGGPHGAPTLAGRFFAAFERGFDRLRMFYGGWLAWALERRALVVSGFVAFVAASMALLPLVGEDFFPTVDAGLIKLHVRGVPGTRIAETERKFARIEDTIRTVIPPGEIQTLLDNIGIPYSGINLSLSEGALVSPADGEIFIALKEGHRPTASFVHKLRSTLPAAFPEQTFFFLAPDISTQVLNFGLPAPIDVQVVGAIGNEEASYGVAQEIAEQVKKIPGAADVHLAQVPKQPELRVDVNRTMAAQLGLTERDVASDLLVSFASSAIVSPSYWLDKRGDAVPRGGADPAAGGQLARRHEHDPHLHRPRSATPASLEHREPVAHRGTGEHHALQRGADVRCPGQRGLETDLGSVSSAVKAGGRPAVKPSFPRGTAVRILRGRRRSMASSFTGLGFGLIFAIVLSYTC